MEQKWIDLKYIIDIKRTIENIEKCLEENEVWINLDNKYFSELREIQLMKEEMNKIVEKMFDKIVKVMIDFADTYNEDVTRLEEIKNI